MKPGDLVRLVGTSGWGVIAIIIQTSGDPVGGGRWQVLKQDGKLGWIGPRFLDKLDETR
jgi:hypothetical protein